MACNGRGFTDLDTPAFHDRIADAPKPRIDRIDVASDADADDKRLNAWCVRARKARQPRQ